MTRYLFVHDREKWEEKYSRPYLLTEEPAQAPVYENAIVLPARVVESATEIRDTMYEGGVCTDAFEFVAGRIRKPGKVSNLDCQGAYEVAPEELERREETVVFGGVLIPQFGHMLIDVSARLWYLARTDEYDKVVFVRYGEYRPVQCDPLMLVRAMGVPDGKIEVVEHPTQFKRVVVPDETFMPLAGYRREFTEVFRAVCAKIPAGDERKVYLSRSRFGDHDIVNEGFFEEFYRRRGFSVVYPETLSFEEQISIVSGADELVTTSGTLAHWILFAKPTARVLILNRRTCVVPQILVEQACGMRCFYVDAGTNPLPVRHVNGPFLLEPNRFFRAYLDECGLSYDPEELDQREAQPELVYRFLQRWHEIYEDPRAASQIRRYTIYHVVKSLHEFFAGEPLEGYEYEDLYLELKDARKKCAKLEKENKELDKESTQSAKALKRARAESKALEKENAQLEGELAASREEVERIRNSKSWKLTAPLRKIRGGKS